MYKYDCIKLECSCWDAYSGSQWCEEHIKFHKEAKIREELYFAENNVKILKKRLEKYNTDKKQVKSPYIFSL